MRRSPVRLACSALLLALSLPCPLISSAFGSSLPNQPPTPANDTGATDEDTPLSGTGLLANDTDPDPGDTLQALPATSTSAQGAAVTVNADGSYLYDPTGSPALNARAAGTSVADTFTYTVADGNGGTATATVTVTVSGVNDAPTANPDQEYTNEDRDVSVRLLANDFDPDTSEYSLRTTPQSFTSALGAAVTLNDRGQLLYDPTASATLNALSEDVVVYDTFPYTVTDGQGGSATGTVTITVRGSNDYPGASAASGATNEDTPTSGGSVLASAWDPDAGDTLHIDDPDRYSELDARVTMTRDGYWTYDPTESDGIQALAGGATVVDRFDYSVEDNHGGYVRSSVYITLTGVNDPPEAERDSAYTDEDTPIAVAAAVGVLVNDRDVDTAHASLSVVGFDATSYYGATVHVYADGRFTYDPRPSTVLAALAAGYSGSDFFFYTVGDGQGGSTQGQVRIYLEGVNDAPVAADDSGATNDHTVLTATAAAGLLANDTDVDTAHAALVVSAFDPVSANGAAVSVNPDGGFTYDPTASALLAALAEGASVADTFAYTVSDGKGGTDAATVTITVTGLNAAPVAGADVGATNEDTPLLRCDLLANDTDLDTPHDDLTVVPGPATSAKGATVWTMFDGAYDYRPAGTPALEALAEGATVDDTFTYVVVDGEGGSATGTVTITVTGRNDAPTGLALDHDRVAERQSVGTLVGTFSTSDVDVGDTHAYSLVPGAGDADNGAFTVAGAELRTARILDRSLSATRTVRVRTADAHGDTFDRQFTVTLTADLGALADAGPDQRVSHGALVTLNGAGSRAGTGALAAYLWTQVSGPPVALSDPTLPSTTFTAPAAPPDQAPVALAFSLWVQDEGGYTAEDGCLVNVGAAGTPPVAHAGDDQTVPPAATVTLDGTASTSVRPLATYSWRQVAGPAVTLSDRAAPRPTFLAPAVEGEGVSLRFELTVTDDDALAGSDSCLVNVTATNLPPAASAGPDQSVDAGDLVLLDGSASLDPAAGVCTYAWRQVRGRPVTLTDPAAVAPAFTAPAYDWLGTPLVFVLTVTEPGGLAASDEVSVSLLGTSTGGGGGCHAGAPGACALSLLFSCLLPSSSLLLLRLRRRPRHATSARAAASPAAPAPPPSV